MGVLIAYSSSAHRNLDLLSTREVPNRTVFRTACLTSLPARQLLPARRVGATPLCRALPGRAVPAATPGGVPPGRDRPGQGADTHPGRAAYRADRGHIRPRSARSAGDRSWPPAPGTPHRCVQGMLRRASGQTRLSLPPRTDLTPSGERSNGCCRNPSHSRPGSIPWRRLLRRHWQCLPGRPWRCLLRRLLGVGPDVDAPAGEPGGEAGVLPLLADRQRQLVVRHGHPGGAGGEVHDLHLAHPSG